MRAVSPSVPASGSSTTAGSWYRQENWKTSETSRMNVPDAVKSKHASAS